MKARGKVVSLLMALVCLVPMFVGALGFGDTASAAIENIDVTLHKKKMDEFPLGGIENTGEEMEDKFGKYEGIEDVRFNVYDITDDFYTKLHAALPSNYTDEQYKAKVKEILKGAYALPSGAQQIRTDTTDENGDVTFSLPDRNDQGIYRVYYFDEDMSTAPAGADKFSQPVILMLPMENESKDIHLYPKNKIEGKITKELLKEDGSEVGDGEEKPYDFEVGKEIKYKATFQVPYQINELVPAGTNKFKTRYSKLVFKDEVSSIGVKFGGISEIKAVDNKTQQKETVDLNAMTKTHGELFPVNPVTGSPAYDKNKKAGFELRMKLNDKTDNSSKTVADFLANYAGKTLEIYYSVVLTEDTPVDIDINNDFKVLMTNDGKQDDKELEGEKPVVTTGGKRFMKHEAGKPDQGLGGAKFVVTRTVASGMEVLKTATGGKREWVPVSGGNLSAGHKFSSDKDGKIVVTGLEYGTYALVEVEAPKGFVKDPTPHSFEVDKGSYDVSLEIEIPNTSQGGFLPSTGGAGIVAFLVVGLSLMGIAIFRYRRVHQNAA